MKHDAKSYERIGKRLKPQNTPEQRELILDDALGNIQKALDQDGHTGALGTRDGIIKGRVQMIGGFLVQCFGMVIYQSQLDPFGKLRWFGWAKRKNLIKGKRADIEFNTETAEPLGFESEHQAGNYLVNLIKIYNQQGLN